MMELCPTGPLYLEVGNGIQSVLQYLSSVTTTTSTKNSSSNKKQRRNMDYVVLRGRYCRFIDTHVAPDEISDVLSMASCLPGLRRLCLLRLQMPVTAITSLLLNSSSSNNNQYCDQNKDSHQQHQHQQTRVQLEELELRSIILSGSTPQEMQALATALQSHSSLVKLVLADCRPALGTLDTLFSSLGHMPALEDVELDMMELSRWLSSPEAFLTLLQNPRLKRLSLSYMRIPEEFILVLAQALTPTNHQHAGHNHHHNNQLMTSHLEEICFDRCDSLSQHATHVMAQMLQHNTSLRKLKLVVKDYNDAIPLAHALQSNTASNLRHLVLRTYHGSEAEPISNHVLHAFRMLLKNNVQLTEVELYQGHPMRPILALDPMAVLYLKLNRAGRKAILTPNNHLNQFNWNTTTTTTTNGSVSINRNAGGINSSNSNNNDQLKDASNEAWIKVILKVQQDTQCVFYLLSHNPSVIPHA